MLGLALMMVGCSQETLMESVEDVSESGAAPKMIGVVIPDFGNVYDEDSTENATGIRSITRAAVNVDGNNYQFVWAADDEIGIFPNTGGQVAFPMSNGAGTQSAVFDGGGWGLKASATYSAYYPVVREFDLDKTNIPMDLSNQEQVGNANYDHIGKLAFMSSPASTVDENGQVTFNFQYQISVLHLIITVPEAKQYNRVMLMASDNLTTVSSLNLSDNTVSGKTELPLQALELQDVEVTDVMTPLEVYMVISPVDLTDKVLKARIYAADGTAYVVTLKSRNYEAGNFYHQERIAEVDETVTGLPTAFLNTFGNAPIVSKEEYIENSYFSVFSASGEYMNGATMKVKGRGNSTWGQPKKPYKMKFNEKCSFFNGTKDKEWILLANYIDKTMIKTAFTYSMAKTYGHFEYVPAFSFLDVVLNGNYNGTYQLGDQLKIGKGRALNGADGYLLEVDSRAVEEAKTGDAVIFYATKISNPFNIKDMSVDGVEDVVADESDANYVYIRDFVLNAESVLYSDNWLDTENGYKKYLDMQSYVEWYLVNEIGRNNDACFYSSCYMNLKMGDNEKLHMGPLWDFDLAYGGSTYNGNDEPEGFWIKKHGWFIRLFNDPEFVSAVKSQYDIYYSHKNDLLKSIDEYAAQIENSAIQNNKLWGVLCSKNSDDETTKQAFRAKVEELKTWIETRMDWMKTEYDAM